jgi:hypothetical protein
MLGTLRLFPGTAIPVCQSTNGGCGRQSYFKANSDGNVQKMPLDMHRQYYAASKETVL